MKFAFLAKAVAIVLPLTIAYAEETAKVQINWSQVSPGNGGTVWYLRIHPADDKTVIESGDMGGTYISVDGSRSYHPVDNLDEQRKCSLLSDIDFCQSAPATGYAASMFNGLFKTTDKGKTFQPLNTSNLNTLYRKYFPVAPFSAVAVNPDDANELWVGLGRGQQITRKRNPDTARLPRGMGYSGDGGQTWTHISNAVPTDALVRKIIISPASWGIGKTVFVATDDGIYLSRDGGKNWRKTEGQLPHDIINDMDIVRNAQTSQPVITVSLQSVPYYSGSTLGFKGGIWQSPDMGRTWKDVTGNLRLPSQLVSGALESRKDGALYSIVARDILNAKFFSQDKIRKRFAPGNDIEQAYHGLSSEWNEFYRQNLPETLKDLQTMIPASHSILPDFHNVRTDPRNPDIIYASIHTMYFPYGVWKTVNGGKSWICTVRGAQGWADPAWAAAYCPPGEPVFNMEQVWTAKQPMNWGTPDLKFGLWDIRIFDLSKSNPDVLYLHSHRITYRSDNGGKTWKDVSNTANPDGSFHGNGNSNMCVFDLAFSQQQNEIIFLMADCGMATSIDSGKSMKIVRDAAFGSNQWVSAAAFDPDDPKHFYLIFHCHDWLTDLKGTYFMESRDFGKTIVNCSTAENGKVKPPPKIAAFDDAINRMLIDPRSPANQRRILVAHSSFNRNSIANAEGKISSRQSKGIFISQDGGKTWQPSNNGIGDNLNIVELSADPKNFDLLYAGVFMLQDDKRQIIPGGLFFSRDSGKNWEKNKTLPLINVFQIVKMPAGVVYAAGGYGKTGKLEYDNNGGLYRSSDEGKTWKLILQAPCVPAFAVSPDNPDLIYAGVEGFNRPQVAAPGIYRSANGGQSWERVNNGMATVNRIMSIRFNPCVKGEVWVGTYGSGFYRTIDPEG